ncbi:MAG: ATP-binding cassette domain-containing protein [Gammaproteobacteria bacterium]|nr:ATP-binding cassette domain-containing protein [Gammaproteobacteria bacterium]
MSLIQTHKLFVSVPGKKICSNLDFVAASGEIWGVLGGNGVGKTSLLNVIAGLQDSDSGQINIAGDLLQNWKRKALARKLGVLFQDSVDTFPTSVFETAMMGRYPYLSFLASEGARDEEIVLNALRDVSMETMRERQVNTLSGGERRRLALATLMAQEPSLWLLDEPTNHLDLHHQISLLDLITNRIREKQGCALMVLHDVNLLNRFCTHAMLMIAHDRIICGSLKEVLSDSNLADLYQHPVRRIKNAEGDYFFPE